MYPMTSSVRVGATLAPAHVLPRQSFSKAECPRPQAAVSSRSGQVSKPQLQMDIW